MYTFGSPRVGNYELAVNIDKIFGAIYRVVHYEDIVPHVPPCSINDMICNKSQGVNPLVSDILWQPWHAGIEIWYNDNFTDYQTCIANFGEDPKCSDSINLLQTSINQHRVYFNIHDAGLCKQENSNSNSIFYHFKNYIFRLK